MSAAMHTAGWRAFDAATITQLVAIDQAGVDRFGEKLAVIVADGPILAVIAEKPMRACQIAARLGVRRFALAIALEALTMRSRVHRDDEGFFWSAA